MARLTATFELMLSRAVRVQRVSVDIVSCRATVDAFDVGLSLIVDETPVTTPVLGSPIRHAGRIKIAVSRDETDDPPAVEPTESGGRDFSNRVQWMEPRTEAYKAIAKTVARRFVLFCKHVLRTPHLSHFGDSEFLAPAWSDTAGTVVESGIVELSVQMIRPSGPHLLGERELTDADDFAVTAALSADRDVTTPQQFLSDAQSSCLNGNVRRAVLELAIACEVAIKYAFFAKGTPAAAAAEYLAERRDIRALDLIDKPALEAFSESFKTAMPAHECNLDYLFRARNKVAHRGVALFRDRQEAIHTVDRPMLESWMQSVLALFQWLELKTGCPT
jgi:hypothetical protein